MIRERQAQDRFDCILRGANLALESLYSRMLEPFGISYADYMVLSAAWESDGMQCGAFALTLGLNVGQ